MEDVEEAITYFEKMIKLESNTSSDEYVKGKTLAIRLKNALNKQFFTQKLFDEYISEIEALDSPGSMYFWLWQHSVHLGYEKGLTVPKDHLWGDRNKNRLKCINNSSFGDLLEIGVWYEILDLNSKPGYVRVISKNNKFKWFPSSCFEEKKKIEREYVQKL